MALLQISDPGRPARARRLAVGIDLGTTNSLVAVAENGGARVLQDEAGRALLPSAVFYGAQEVAVGFDALAHRAESPRATLLSVKRLMGRSAADARAQDHPLAAEIESGAADSESLIKLRTAQGAKTPVEISAEILRVLKDRAQAQCGEPVAGAVVTAPAYFDEGQRQATKDAARLAGIDVLRLLNEPTAAAVAYGLDAGAEGLFVVYDLGGGTFDVSILRLSRGVFEVVATGGDAALGGDDFDRALAVRSLRGAGADWESLAPAERLSALQAAREMKETLSAQEAAAAAATIGGGALALAATRDDLAATARPLIDRTLRIAARALADAELKESQIDAVVMVGGSTRMPAVKEAVKARFGRPLADALDPDEVVAIGAAIQAEILAGNRRDETGHLLLDVTPLSLGIETMGGLVEKIIPRNSPLPVARGREFTTRVDGQTAILLHIVQGERERVADCRSLARFTLSGLPPRPAGQARMRVEFQVDADGLLVAAAEAAETGVRAQIEIKPSYGLGADEIARMLQESFARAGEDADLRRLLEARADGENACAQIAKALAEDGDLTDEKSRAAIESAAESLRRAVAAAGGIEAKNPAAARGASEKIIRAAKALERASEGFAARRMNAGMQKALAGRRVDDL